MWRWKRYVPISERISKSKCKINKLRKKGKIITPIEIIGRTIAKEFWGKKWCEHIEAFSDYDNRLPRGRTYARNGSICHLEIKKECIEAIVSGSDLYHIKIEISSLKKSRWESIKDKCKGQVGSLLEILSGKLSGNVMEVVADHKNGLFPNEGEIKFSCDCLDWADMCKHIAAVLYGVGHRLDKEPDLLFLLRGVDASDLITTELQTTTTETDNIISDGELSDIFDIDLDETTNSLSPKQKTPVSKQSLDSKTITGYQLRKIRTELDLSVKELADELCVSTGSIYRWEKISDTLGLHPTSIHSIDLLLEKNVFCSE